MTQKANLDIIDLATELLRSHGFDVLAGQVDDATSFLRRGTRVIDLDVHTIGTEVKQVGVLNSSERIGLSTTLRDLADHVQDGRVCYVHCLSVNTPNALIENIDGFEEDLREQLAALIVAKLSSAYVDADNGVALAGEGKVIPWAAGFSIFEKQRDGEKT